MLTKKFVVQGLQKVPEGGVSARIARLAQRHDGQLAHQIQKARGAARPLSINVLANVGDDEIYRASEILMSAIDSKIVDKKR